MIYTENASIVRGFLKNIMKNSWRSKQNKYVILYLMDHTTGVDYLITGYDKKNDLMIGAVDPPKKQGEYSVEYTFLSSLYNHHMSYETYSKKKRYTLKYAVTKILKGSLKRDVK